MKKIGIIGAMEIEVEKLKADMTGRREVEKARMVFCEGELSGMPAVVVRSGIGKVNAAVCTQILVDDFGVDAVINTGVAGSLDARINIGDIVISTDVLHHDMDAVNFGYPLGQIPQMPVFSFEADASLTALAEEVCRKVNPAIGIHHGRIVSGDQFVADKASKERIVSNFKGSCTEMEGAAIAQSAYLNNIPFLIVRAISDKADDSASMDYPTFEREAAQHCVRLVEGLLEKLAAQ
ncbi:MAG: 5'-methylthioadenosine/adenosylhomocysteine nucleosidase [Clostridiales bacterium]|nr:5'-methylthioadenosine/adenosylhomocysteine nucleosidase [Clostridiales bacterium]